MKTQRVYRGMSLIIGAIFGFVLIAFMGLAIDESWTFLTAHQLQNAADAAALAGANGLNISQTNAQTSATNTAAGNGAGTITSSMNGGTGIQLTQNPDNDTGGDIVLGTWDTSNNIFTPTLNNPNAVQVLARLTSNSPNGALPLFFGPMVGIKTVDVYRSAIAFVSTSNAGILLLDPSSSGALTMTGSGGLNVQNASIDVDSTSNTAVDVSGSGGISINQGQMDIAGSTNSSNKISATINDSSQYVSNPLASLPTPTPPGNIESNSTDNIGGNSAVTLQPGTYIGGISYSGSKSLTLEPGLYYMQGGGFKDSGSGSLTGSGVTIYSDGGGSIDLTASGPLTLSAPTSGTYAGIVIFQNPTSNQQISITGSQDVSISGTLYAAAALVDFTGSGASLGIKLIADDLKLTQSGTITFNSSGGISGAIPYLVQ